MIAYNKDALEARVDKLTQTVEELKNQLVNDKKISQLIFAC